MRVRSNAYLAFSCQRTPMAVNAMAPRLVAIGQGKDLGQECRNVGAHYPSTNQRHENGRHAMKGEHDETWRIGCLRRAIRRPGMLRFARGGDAKQFPAQNHG